MLFDAYLMVDWSGRSTLSPPSPSADAIWIGERSPGVISDTYCRGRAIATRFVRDRVRALAGAGSRVLVGFDFPFGYPRGLADRLAPGAGAPRWRVAWDRLGAEICDDEGNANNRFDVAAAMNRDIGLPGPFWGRPTTPAIEGLTVTKAFDFSDDGLPRLRATERAMPGVQETWKLYGSGSVGSQALLGIPRVRGLRDDPELSDISAIWPFETGFTETPDAQVVFAEIWPGAVPVPDEPTIRDLLQVRAMCRWAQAEDRRGSLSGWFAPALDPETAAAALAEEGWILG